MNHGAVLETRQAAATRLAVARVATSPAPLPSLMMGVAPEALESMVGPLVERVADQVVARLLERETTPALLDRNGLAKALGVSVATIERLVKSGLPFVKLVDSKRYILADAMEWLRSRKGGK